MTDPVVDTDRTERMRRAAEALGDILFPLGTTNRELGEKRGSFCTLLAATVVFAHDGVTPTEQTKRHMRNALAQLTEGSNEWTSLNMRDSPTTRSPIS